MSEGQGCSVWLEPRSSLGPPLAQLLSLFTQLLRWDWGFLKESLGRSRGAGVGHTLPPPRPGNFIARVETQYLEFQKLYFME